MIIFNDLIGSITRDSAIRQLLVGVHWTVVFSHNCGMASTVMSKNPHGEGRVRDAGELESRSALQLAQYVHSENTLEASIGLAAINSLIELPNHGLVEINAFKYLVERGEEKNVAVFGHFPYLDDLRKTSKQLIVFELNPIEGEHNLSEVPTLLPKADVVAITSNSLINHTLEGILPYIDKNAFVAMVGPSTPLSSVLFDYGISMLSGVRIVNETVLYQSVSQAAIFRQTKGTELITWIKE